MRVATSECCRLKAEGPIHRARKLGNWQSARTAGQGRARQCARSARAGAGRLAALRAPQPQPTGPHGAHCMPSRAMRRRKHMPQAHAASTLALLQHTTARLRRALRRARLAWLSRAAAGWCHVRLAGYAPRQLSGLNRAAAGWCRAQGCPSSACSQILWGSGAGQAQETESTCVLLRFVLGINVCRNKHMA